MLADRLAESLLHARPPLLARLRGLSAHRLLGRRLRPFAAWHAALLDWAQSPFAGHSGAVNLAALDTAASLCTSEYPHAALPRRGALRACVLSYRYGRSLLQAHAAFSAYLADYTTAPIFGTTEQAAPGDDEDRPAPPKHPPYLLDVVQLMKLGLSRRDAWMMPIGEARWILTAHFAAKGDPLKAMLDDEDLEVLAENNAAAARAAK